MDYKEILRNKATQLRALVAKYRDSLDETTLNDMNILIENTIQITDGRLDALDYDVRNDGIMNYHSQLDTAFSKLQRFQEQEQDKNTTEK